MERVEEFMLKDKTLLITGGTGSFGNAVLNRFLREDVAEIRIFSRDEKKQDDMRRMYKSSKLRFYVGDVRNQDSIMDAMRDVDLLLFDIPQTIEDLGQLVSQADFVFHLAGINRPEHPDEFTAGNYELTKTLLDLIINKSVWLKDV